jgi:hypothetical protein
MLHNEILLVSFVLALVYRRNMRIPLKEITFEKIFSGHENTHPVP